MTAPLDVASRVRTFIDAALLTRKPPRPLDDEMPLLEGLLDSSALMQLTTYLEEEFGVEIDDSDFLPENFKSVGDIARLVGSKLGEEPSPALDLGDAGLPEAEG